MVRKSEVDKVKQELLWEAEDVGNREELSEFIFMIVSALRDEELPDMPLNAYLRAAAQAIRRMDQESRTVGATGLAKSEWRLTAEALVEALASN